MAEIRDVTDASFTSEVLESDRGVIVDFWGEHCPACRQISPILRDLANDVGDRVHVLKMQAEENIATASRYGIRAMPTVLGFRDGQVVGQLVGARPRADFDALVEKVV